MSSKSQEETSEEIFSYFRMLEPNSNFRMSPYMSHDSNGVFPKRTETEFCSRLLHDHYMPFANQNPMGEMPGCCALCSSPFGMYVKSVINPIRGHSYQQSPDAGQNQQKQNNQRSFKDKDSSVLLNPFAKISICNKSEFRPSPDYPCLVNNSSGNSKESLSQQPSIKLGLKKNHNISPKERPFKKINTSVLLSHKSAALGLAESFSSMQCNSSNINCTYSSESATMRSSLQNPDYPCSVNNSSQNSNDSLSQEPSIELGGKKIHGISPKESPFKKINISVLLSHIQPASSLDSSSSSTQCNSSDINYTYYSESTTMQSPLQNPDYPCLVNNSFGNSDKSLFHELNGEPAVKKFRRIPPEERDAKYFERRRKNNIAAKKSRDARRNKEDSLAKTCKEYCDITIRLEAEACFLKESVRIKEQKLEEVTASLLSFRENCEGHVKDLFDETFESFLS
ncbi:Hepatic leukemia factor like protein [Argiope bruennichi]|uniref:Hepatic leukemia factor like protein n=1 Tax=Argiope bruennichi TaxID=94029 RepID=A0A8T0G0S9_ARGBR|nr:Hepatic leukemia factor like protein [Argiope bruennichi]